jgi:hypothetical protein
VLRRKVPQTSPCEELLQKFLDVWNKEFEVAKKKAAKALLDSTSIAVGLGLNLDVIELSELMALDLRIQKEQLAEKQRACAIFAAHVLDECCKENEKGQKAGSVRP